MHKPNGFPRSERLKSSDDFKSLYTGKRFSGSLLIVYYDMSGGELRKAAFVVSKKVSPLATDRNRLKRRFREIYRCEKHSLPQGARLIVRAFPQARTASFDEIKKELTSFFSKIVSQQHRNRTDRDL